MANSKQRLISKRGNCWQVSYRANNFDSSKRGSSYGGTNCSPTGNSPNKVFLRIGSTLCNHEEPQMDWDVVKVKPLDGYRLHLKLADGKEGIVDLTPLLSKKGFQELQDRDYFCRVFPFLGALTWPNGQDISPEWVLEHLTPNTEEVPV